MTFRALLCAPLLLWVATTESSAQKSAEALLQEAVNQELVVGDLRKAIALYQEIADRHASNRRAAAQALANLGRSFEKLGEAEATSAYQRLVRDFADQSAPVKFARDRLAALNATTADRGGLRLRKVWESTEGFSSISPDGRYVAFQDWGRHSDPVLRNRADVAIYDTRERRIRLLTNRPALTLVDVYPTGPFIWSGDAQWFAYGLHAVGWTHRELHIVRPDGRDDRRVLDNRNMADVRAMGFSSDNRFILALLKGWDNVWRIGTVSVRDSSLTIVKTLGIEAPFALSLSPDDRYIAYNYAQSDSNTTTTDLFVLAVDGSKEVRVAPHAAHDVAAFWTPDGGRVVFVSLRSGQRAVWSVRWRNGAVVGEPEVVYPHMGAMQLRGITRSGALYFSAEAGGSEAYEGTIDISRDSTVRDVRPIPSNHLLTNLRPAWSLDGTRVAWLSRRAMGDTSTLVVKTLSSGTERAYPLPFPSGDFRQLRVDWSTDGRVVRVQGRDVQKRMRGSFLVELESGTVSQEQYLREFAGHASDRVTEYFFVDDRQSAALRRLGIRIVGQTDVVPLRNGDLVFRPGEQAVVVRNGVYRILSPAAFAAAPNDNPGSSMSEQLSPIGHMGSWRLSPDGTRIAAAIASDTVMMSNVLHIVPLPGGPSREVDRIERSAAPESGQGFITSVRWTPDGKSVLYAKTRQASRPGEYQRETVEFWMVDVDGGPPRRLPLKLSPYQLSTMAFHPDGRRVAFTEWRNAVTEAWVAEGMPWQQNR